MILYCYRYCFLGMLVDGLEDFSIWIVKGYFGEFMVIFLLDWSFKF